MRKRVAVSTVLVMAALSGFARSEENADEIMQLREQVRLQQQQLQELMRRLDQLEQAQKPVGQPQIQPALETRVSQFERKAETLDKKVTEENEAIVKKQEKLAWAEIIKINGDIRYRYESREVDDESIKSRHRFRARVGTYIDATNQLGGGIRLASGSSEEAFSANQTLESYATEKQIWIDLAYIDYHPDYAPGLNLIAGKIQQPWIDVDTLFWDDDVNPEGISLTYNRNKGSRNLFAHIGHFFMSAENKDDVRMTSAQLAGSTKLTKNVGARIGGTAYIWHDIQDHDIPLDKAGKVLSRGNSTTINSAGDIAWASKFNILHGFADINVKTKPVNLTFFGETSKNTDAINEKDAAWLAGVGAKRGKFSINYNFRDMQQNSIIGLFTDSDMADGVLGRGHKIKAKYEINKYLNLGAFYSIFDTYKGANDRTLLLDAVLKF